MLWEPLCFSLSISCKSAFAFFLFFFPPSQAATMRGDSAVRISLRSQRVWQCFGSAANLNALITNTVTLPPRLRNTFCFFPWKCSVLTVGAASQARRLLFLLQPRKWQMCVRRIKYRCASLRIICLEKKPPQRNTHLYLYSYSYLCMFTKSVWFSSFLRDRSPIWTFTQLHQCISGCQPAADELDPHVQKKRRRWNRALAFPNKKKKKFTASVAARAHKRASERARAFLRDFGWARAPVHLSRVLK